MKFFKIMLEGQARVEAEIYVEAEDATVARRKIMARLSDESDLLADVFFRTIGYPGFLDIKLAEQAEPSMQEKLAEDKAKAEIKKKWAEETLAKFRGEKP